MSDFVQEITNAGVANGPYIESSGSFTAGTSILIFCGNYNDTVITAAHFSKPAGTATIGSFVRDHFVKRDADNVSEAIVRVPVVTSGTATIRLTLPNTNYYFMYLQERTGLGPVVATGDGQNTNSTTPATGSALSSSVYGECFAVYTNVSGTVTSTPAAGWDEEHELEDNTIFCHAIISRDTVPFDAADSANTSYTPTWTLGNNANWLVCAVIYALEQPDVFDFGGTSSPSPNTAVQSQTLASPYMISANSRLYVAFAPWSTPASAAIDPTIAMVSDNLGNAASSYERLVLLDTATYAGGADSNVPGIAWFESPAIASDVGAPTVTIDVDPGGSNTGYWTGAVLVIKNPSTDDDTRIAAAVSDYRPTIADPGTIPTIVPFASGDRDHDHSVIACFGFNRGHDDGADIEIPTQGGTWTKGQAWNEESSQFWSGLLAWLETTGTGAIAPTMVISRNDGATVTKTRGVMIIVNLADGTPVGGGGAVPIIMQMLH